jgi:hypothetical protein
MKLALYYYIGSTYDAGPMVVLEYRDRGTDYVQVSEPVEVDLAPYPDAKERAKTVRRESLEAQIQRLREAAA